MATIIVIEDDEDEPQGPQGPIYMDWRDAAVLGLVQGSVLGLFVGAIDFVVDDTPIFFE